MADDTPKQIDMFTGELVDTRSDYRKRKDRQRSKPKQMEMFSLRETVEFGVNARPWRSKIQPGRLVLEREDPRDEEEIERDLMREAARHTYAMFPGAGEGATDGQSVAEGSQVPRSYFLLTGCARSLPRRPPISMSSAYAMSIRLPRGWTRTIARRLLASFRWRS